MILGEVGEALELVGVFVTLLPLPYRRWWPQPEEELVGPAFVSGFLQALLSLLSFFRATLLTCRRDSNFWRRQLWTWARPTQAPPASAS